MSETAFCQESEIRRECVQKIAEFYGVESGSKKEIEGTNVGGRKCQVSISFERFVSGISNEEIQQISLFMNSANEYSEGRLAKKIWATLSDKSELERVKLVTCEIEDGRLNLEFAVKHLTGWRKNQRFQVVATANKIQMKEKEWGLFTSGGKDSETCQF